MMILRSNPIVAEDVYKIGEEYVEIYRVVNRYQDITQIFI